MENKRSTKESITEDEYMALVGIFHIAVKLNQQLEDLRSHAVAITGEIDSHGHTSDQIYSPDDKTLDEMLAILGVSVAGDR